jgi:hypothetical protein
MDEAVGFSQDTNGSNVVSSRRAHGDDYACGFDFRMRKYDSFYLNEAGPGRGSSPSAL